MNALKQLIKEIDSLKPVPQIVNKILAITKDPDSSVADMAEIVMYDPMITADLLKSCNSAYFNLPRKVESVNDAIALLGMNHIVDLVLIKGCSANLKKKQEGYGLNEGDLWRQAVSCAIITKDIANKQNIDNQQMLFTCALLKDIGKVILDRFVGDSFTKIFNLVQKKQISFREAEKKIIGIDHAEIGAIVAKKWNFSPKMVYIIRNHHMSDEKAENDIATSIVFLSDIICMMMGIGVGHDGLAYRFHKNALTLLNISEKNLMEIIASFGGKMQKVEELINGI